MRTRTWLLVLVVALASGAIGVFVGLSLGRAAPGTDGRARAEARRGETEVPAARPRLDGGSDSTESEVERLQGVVASLRQQIRGAQPVRLAEETGDPTNAAIRVEVLDEEGRPQPGIEVSVIRPAHPYRNEKRATDAAGCMQVHDLMPGGVNIQILSPEMMSSRFVLLTAGRVTEVSMLFPRGGVAVTGTLVDLRAGALPGVIVSLMQREGEAQLLFQTKTDERGRYRFEQVPPGAFTLSAALGTSADGRHAVCPILVPRESPVEQDLKVGFRSIFGVVRSATSGLAIPGCVVRVMQPNGVFSREVGEDGEFEFLDLIPRSYSVRAHAPGHVPSPRTEISVVAGKEERQDFALDPAAVVILTILDPQGSPVLRSVHVSIRPQGERSLFKKRTAGAGGVLKLDEIRPGQKQIEIGVQGVGSAKLTATLETGENHLTVRLQD